MSLKKYLKNMDSISCSKESTVAEIAKIMKSRNIGTVLVKEYDRPIGIITDRDLVVRCLANDTDHSKKRAKDVMTSPVNSVKDSSSIMDIVDTMSFKKVRRLCVVNDKGVPLGILSMADIFELLSYEIGQLSNALGKRNQKLFSRSDGIKLVV